MQVSMEARKESNESVSELRRELLSVDDAADLLGCTAQTIEDRLRIGELPGLKFGRGWVIPKQALIYRLNEMALEQAAARRGETAPSEGPTPEATAAALARQPQRRGLPSVPPPRPQPRNRTTSG